MGNRRTGCCRCGRPRRGLGLAANDDRVGGAHPLLRSVLLGRGRRRRSASGDPGVGARRTRVPAAMAGGYDGVRGRSASGARVQGSNARRLGCPADRGSADGAGRPASRLARCAAPRRLRCGRAGRVDRRGFVRIPSPGRAESSAGPRHRLERAREPAGPRGLPRFCGSGFRSGGRDDPHRTRGWREHGFHLDIWALNYAGPRHEVSGYLDNHGWRSVGTTTAQLLAAHDLPAAPALPAGLADRPNYWTCVLG